MANISAMTPPRAEGRKRRPLVASRRRAHNRLTPFGSRDVVFKLAVVLMLVLVIGSLFSGLFFLYRDKGDGSRVLRALTIRITLSLLLFIVLLLGYRFGAYSQ